jgi:hypothetical protein
MLLELSNQGSTEFNRGNNAMHKILLRKLRWWWYKIWHEGEDKNSFGSILGSGRCWVLGSVHSVCSTIKENWLHVNTFRTKIPHNKENSRHLIQHNAPYSTFQYWYLMHITLNT